MKKDPRIAVTPTNRGVADATSAPKTKTRSRNVRGMAIDSARIKSFSILWLIAYVITPAPDA